MVKILLGTSLPHWSVMHQKHQLFSLSSSSIYRCHRRANHATARRSLPVTTINRQQPRPSYSLATGCDWLQAQVLRRDICQRFDWVTTLPPNPENLTPMRISKRDWFRRSRRWKAWRTARSFWFRHRRSRW